MDLSLAVTPQFRGHRAPFVMSDFIPQCTQCGQSPKAGELCRKCSKSQRQRERKRVPSIPLLLPTRNPRDDSTFLEHCPQPRVSNIGRMVPTMDSRHTDLRVPPGYYPHIVPRQNVPPAAPPALPMFLQGMMPTPPYPNVPMPHFNARGELIPPDQPQPSFASSPLPYTPRNVVPLFVRTCMRNECRARLPPQYIGMICKGCIHAGYLCPPPGHHAAEHNMDAFSNSVLPRHVVTIAPPLGNTPTPSKPTYPRAGDQCQQHEDSADDEELILRYPEEPIVIDDTPRVTDNKNTNGTIMVQLEASEVSAGEGIAHSSEVAVASSSKQQLHGSSPRKRMRRQSNPQPAARIKKSKPSSTTPRSAKTWNKQLTSTSTNAGLDRIRAERHCKTDGCPARVPSESRWPRCTKCSLKRWKSRFGFRREGKGKEKEIVVETGQMKSRERNDNSVDEHLGQTLPEDGNNGKPGTATCETTDHDMQDVTESVPLQQESEDNTMAALNEEMVENMSDSQQNEVAMIPTTMMGGSATGADEEYIPATAEGVEGNHSQQERDVSPQNGVAMRAAEDACPMNGSQDGSAMLQGWDSDLTDLSSSDDGESEIDMIESDDNIPKVKLTIRIPPRPFLAISQSSFQRKCSVKACKNHLELDYRWKMCAHCRAHAREAHRRRLWITFGNATSQGVLDNNVQAARGPNELPNTLLVNSENQDTTLPSTPSTSTNPDTFVLGTTDTRICTIRRCQKVLPSFWEYRWKMCESCRLRTRLLQRRRKETIPPLTGEDGETEGYVNGNKDLGRGYTCERNTPVKVEYPGIQSRHVSSCCEAEKGRINADLVAVDPRRGYRYCSNRACEILLKSGSTSLECEECQTRRPAKLHERSPETLEESKDGRTSKENLTAPSYSKPPSGNHDKLLNQRHNDQTSTPPPPYPQYQNFQSLISIFKARLDSFLEAQSFYMLYKLNDAGNDGPAAFRFDGEYSIIVPDFDIKGRAKQVEASVVRTKEALEGAGGFEFKVKSVSNSQSGGILTRMKCIRQVFVPLPVASDGGALTGSQDKPDRDSTTLAKTMRGEVEVAVLKDFSHRFFPGERHIIRFRLVG